MSFFGSLFSPNKKNESVVLVEVGADSVAGAYVAYAEGELPILLYTRRLTVETREGEPRDKSMLRALKILADTLLREGAPVLSRATGSGASDAVLLSINAPWQKSSVRTERFVDEDDKEFSFTKSAVSDLLKKTEIKLPRYMRVDETVIGTILNGYKTQDPYGKKAHRASIIVLTSFVNEHITKNALSTLQGVFHTKNVRPLAGSALRFQTILRAFPHERDALILDATGALTSIAFVHRGLFIAITEVSDTDKQREWMEHVGVQLAELAKHYPLPRTIFLLAQESDMASFRKKLDAGDLGKFWLSDNPPKIVPVLPSHLLRFVRVAAAAAPDLPLLLMTLFHGGQTSEES
jgi:hypothetical protein